MNNRQPVNPIQAIVQAVLMDPPSYRSARCPKCGGTLYDRATIIKEIPATHPLNPAGKTQNLNLETFVCRSRGHLLDERLGANPGPNEADA